MEEKTIYQTFEKYGVSVEKALNALKNIPLSIQCWQLDDVSGFENKSTLSGVIASTGNYPYKARNFEELISDFALALSLIPGKKKMNIHAIYQSDEVGDRKDISIKNFERWVDFAKEHGYGIDFNPTVFSSEKLVDNLSLSSPIEEVRNYWITHCVNAIKTSEAIGKELNETCLCNIWVPDGAKESPANRMALRKNLKDSLDKILSYPFDEKYCKVSLESKVFGIGVESFTVGSNEFYLNYVSHNKKVINLIDMGHYHPNENVADKISSILLFNNSLAMHISRPVRWDSDHVVKLNDDLQEVCDELVKSHRLNDCYIGLDYFDGSINRIAALVIGARNFIKAMLRSLLTPWDTFKKLQDEGKHTEILLLQEEMKTLPWQEVYHFYLEKSHIKDEYSWYDEVKNYEEKVMKKRKE